MIKRENISPLLIIGIGLVIISIFGVIFFTLPLIKSGKAFLSAPHPWIPLLSVIGIFIGGILLLFGIYFSLESVRTKGIFLISIGPVLLIFELYYLIFFLIVTYPYFVSSVYPIIPIMILTLVLIRKGIKYIFTPVGTSENNRKTITLKKYPKQIFEINPDCQHCALARSLGLKECPNCSKKLIK